VSSELSAGFIRAKFWATSAGQAFWAGIPSLAAGTATSVAIVDLAAIVDPVVTTAVGIAAVTVALADLVRVRIRVAVINVLRLVISRAGRLAADSSSRRRQLVEKPEPLRRLRRIRRQTGQAGRSCRRSLRRNRSRAGSRTFAAAVTRAAPIRAVPIRAVAIRAAGLRTLRLVARTPEPKTKNSL